MPKFYLRSYIKNFNHRYSALILQNQVFEHWFFFRIRLLLTSLYFSSLPPPISSLLSLLCFVGFRTLWSGHFSFPRKSPFLVALATAAFQSFVQVYRKKKSRCHTVRRKQIQEGEINLLSWGQNVLIRHAFEICSIFHVCAIHNGGWCKMLKDKSVCLNVTWFMRWVSNGFFKSVTYLKKLFNFGKRFSRLNWIF